VVGRLQEELAELRAAQAKSGAMLEAAQAEATRFQMQLELAKPQVPC
jgi:hypothetical protein